MATRLRFLGGSAALCVALAAPARADSSPRLAILISPEDGATDADIERFRAQLESGVLNANHFVLVDRARLKAVLAEQGLSNSAYADPTTAAHLGKVLGASSILFVTLGVDVEKNEGTLVTSVTFDANSNYRMIDVSTARVRESGSADGSSESRSPAGGEPTALAKTRRAALDACAADLAPKDK